MTSQWILSLGHLNLLDRLRALPRRCLHLNFFIIPHRSSTATLSRERWTTRLYLFLWLVTLTVLIIYNSFAEETTTVHVSKPDEATYNQLYASYKTSLQCPCSSIAVAYNSFTQLNAQLHQVCYSIFLDDIWINNIFDGGNWSNLAANDFRGRGVLHFLLLKSLCGSAQRAVEKTIMEALKKQIFKGILVPKEQLLSEINRFVEMAKNWNTDEFRLLATTIHGIMHSNQLMNVFSLNWKYGPIPANANLSNYLLSTQPVSHGPNCSCAVSSSCTEPVLVDGMIVPGFAFACSPMRSLLRSSLICLYNATCIERINFGNLSSIRPLDSMLPSRYSAESVVDEFLINGLVEKWSMNVSYSTFFSVCQASFCSYSMSERRSLFQIITLLLGLYGGLSFIFRLVTPWLITMMKPIVLSVYRQNNRVVALM